MHPPTGPAARDPSCGVLRRALARQRGPFASRRRVQGMRVGLQIADAGPEPAKPGVSGEHNLPVPGIFTVGLVPVARCTKGAFCMPGKSAGHGVEGVPREPVGPAGGSPATVGRPEVTGSGGAPDQHDLRLMALLAELVRERGRAGAAEALDLDPRTVVAALKRGTLSRRVRSALERVGTAEGREEEDEPAEAGATATGVALAERVAAVEQEVHGVRELVQADGRALREEQTRDLRQVERRLARLESLLGAPATAPGTTPGGELIVGGPASRETPEGSREGTAPEPIAAATPVVRRQHPGLVTREPAPDDAQVYGEAWALVDEWRRLWQVHERPGKGLA